MRPDTYEALRKARHYLCQAKKWKELYEECSVPCVPTIITLNTEDILSVEACSAQINLGLVDLSSTPLEFTIDGNDIVVNCGSAEPVDIYFNDNPFAQVDCGEDFFFYIVDQDDNPVVPISIDGNTIQVDTQDCGTVQINVNGNAFYEADCGETVPISIVDSDEDPVTILNITGTQITVQTPCADATIQLTSPSGVLQTVTGASGSTTSQTLRTIGRMPYRTGSSGASTPPVDGVDGLTQRGRNFLTLDYNNAWGNTNRFTWKDGTQVYPNGVTAEGGGYAVDNSTWDRNGKVLLIAYVTTTRTFANQATTALTTTIDGLSGWEMINSEELSEITTGNSVVNKQVNYAPFNIAEGTIIITSTETVNNNIQCLSLTSSGVEGSISKAGLRNTFFVKVATLTIDSLGNVTIS
jgi:hypothetical protein